MPVYRFVFTDGRQSVELVDLPDLRAARIEAAKALGEVLRDGAEAFWSTGGCRLVVQDDAALTLLEIDAVGVIAPAGSGGA